MKAVKKPVVVEFREAIPGEVIKTLEGDLIASEGDVIITGVQGEQYPCKREIFLETYKGFEMDGVSWFWRNTPPEQESTE